MHAMPLLTGASHRFQALAKQIRDQLRIKKHLRGFETFGLRRHAISRAYPSGKFYPQLSFQGHMREIEKVIEARLTYFRKHSMYYSGWSMQKWWDKKLRAEENKKRAQLYFYSGEERDMRVLIGRSIQDRLREAARRELSYVEKNPSWDKKTVRRSRNCPVPAPLNINPLNARIVGQLNVTQIPLPKAPCKERKHPSPAQSFKITSREPKPKMPADYLPIVFHWKEMATSKGYPPLKLEDTKCSTIM